MLCYESFKAITCTGTDNTMLRDVSRITQTLYNCIICMIYNRSFLETSLSRQRISRENNNRRLDAI